MLPSALNTRLSLPLSLPFPLSPLSPFPSLSRSLSLSPFPSLSLSLSLPLSPSSREIRQEVSILAVLDHHNLTKLCGARVSPHMCLLLELAPRGSLRGMLKEYKKHAAMLEPVTLQSSIDQVYIIMS